MQLRDLELSDLVTLEKDNLPSLFNGPFRLRKTILSDKGEVLGIFWVRVTVEVSILLNKNLNNLEKARSIKEIGKFLYDGIPEELGISDAFVTFDKDEYDERYLNILKKHFNFQEIRSLRVRRNDG